MSRINRLLNSSVAVWRFTKVPDGMGGYAETWSQVGTVRARLSQPSATERVAAAQSEAKLSHVVYLHSGADVRRGDQLRMPGRSFDVLAVFEPSAAGTYLRADCDAHQP